MIRRSLSTFGAIAVALVIVFAAGLQSAAAVGAQESISATDASVLAQDAQPYGEAAVEPAAAATQNDFQAAQQRQAQARTLRGYWHLFIAFAVTWMLLFGYAIVLGRRFGRLEQQLERLGG